MNKPLSAPRADVGNATGSRADSTYRHTPFDIMQRVSRTISSINDPFASP